MRMNWIVLVVSISILIVLCDAKKKKFSKNEASEGSKSNDESMKPSKEVKTRDEKPSKAKYKSDEKRENKQAGRKLNAEDKTEKTSTGSQETVARHEEKVVSESIVAEKTEPSATLEAEGGASPSAQGKPVKEKKTTKSKPAKKTNKQLKKEKVVVGKEQVADAVEEPAREIVNEKAEL